ncbi:hypothetical protein EI94DRAFT_1111878 [Lactarius quietus]|nr:hypothetical protein EI94DRAFT_1111878 [Lactarius quietus]
MGCDMGIRAGFMMVLDDRAKNLMIAWLRTHVLVRAGQNSIDKTGRDQRGHSESFTSPDTHLYTPTSICQDSTCRGPCWGAIQAHGSRGRRQPPQYYRSSKIMHNAPSSFDQAQLSAEDIMLATGKFSEDERWLGITACSNRPTATLELKLELDIDIASGGPQDNIAVPSSTTISDPIRARPREPAAL